MCLPRSAAAGTIRQSKHPRPLANELPPFGKRQNKVQEQGRLQDPGNDIAPVNYPIEVIQFAGVLERIGDERNQAENIEVRGSGCGPATQQDVDADAQVNQGNQAQRIIQRAICGSQDDVGIQRHRLADQRVGRLGPNARVVELAHQSRSAFDFLAVDGN